MCSTRLKDNRVEPSTPMKSFTSEDSDQCDESCRKFVFDPATQKLYDPLLLVVQLYGFPQDDTSGLLGSSTKDWSCWTSHRQTSLSTSTRSFSSSRRASKTEVFSSLHLQTNLIRSSRSLKLFKSFPKCFWLLNTYFHHSLNIQIQITFIWFLTSK